MSPSATSRLDLLAFTNANSSNTGFSGHFLRSPTCLSIMTSHPWHQQGFLFHPTAAHWKYIFFVFSYDHLSYKSLVVTSWNSQQISSWWNNRATLKVTHVVLATTTQLNAQLEPRDRWWATCGVGQLKILPNKRPASACRKYARGLSRCVVAAKAGGETGPRRVWYLCSPEAMTRRAGRGRRRQHRKRACRRADAQTANIHAPRKSICRRRSQGKLTANQPPLQESKVMSLYPCQNNIREWNMLWPHEHAHLFFMQGYGMDYIMWSHGYAQSRQHNWYQNLWRESDVWVKCNIPERRRAMQSIVRTKIDR